MHEVLVNRLGGLSLARKSVVRLTDRPEMTLDVYCGRKTTQQHSNVKVTVMGVTSDFLYTQGSNWETFCTDFLVSGRSVKPGFTFVYIFHTFILPPQMKIGSRSSLFG